MYANPLPKHVRNHWTRPTWLFVCLSCSTESAISMDGSSMKGRHEWPTLRRAAVPAFSASQWTSASEVRPRSRYCVPSSCTCISQDVTAATTRLAQTTAGRRDPPQAAAAPDVPTAHGPRQSAERGRWFKMLL